VTQHIGLGPNTRCAPASGGWRVRHTRRVLVGVDWGGTKIEIVALTPDGQEHLRRRRDTPRGDYDACLRIIGELVEDAEERVGRIERVGIGIPGSIDPLTGLGKGASSTWLIGRPVEQDLRSALGGRGIRAANDADLLAASEARDGAGAGYRVVYTPNLASGVGAGVAIDGRVHHGPNNNAADWGHNPLPWPRDDEVPGPSCWCGLPGCIETWVSGRAFQAQFEAAAGERLHGSQIVGLARSGDALASALLDRYVERLARGLAVVVNTLDPDIFVLGGGMSNVDELYERLPALILRYAFTTVFTTPIVKSRHGDSSGVRGAAWLWADD
jgi:fructokinase